MSFQPIRTRSNPTFSAAAGTISTGSPSCTDQIADVDITRRVENRPIVVDARDDEIRTSRLVSQIIRERRESHRRAPFEASAVVTLQGTAELRLGVLNLLFQLLTILLEDRLKHNRRHR